MNYDLEERCGKFGEAVINLCQELRNNDINRPLINQIIRSATSIGANYMEANEAASTKDFRNKIRISQKEANETKHWIRMIAAANPEKKDKCRIIWQEAHELTLIFATISRKPVKN
ncbi:MAG: four helix bundle protein [Patescibacteria group bacterium]|nr:four helix bundle protein [Patescibacteria group bacterium]